MCNKRIVLITLACLNASGLAAFSANEQLVEAINCFSVDGIVDALDNGADIETRGNDGATALIQAARYANPATITALLAKGANINAHNDHGKTALMLAACRGHREMVRVLLATKNADVNITDNAGISALMYAAQCPHRSLIPSMYVTECDFLGVVLELLANGAFVNSASFDGKTVLMHAALGGHVDIVTTLLNAGARINDITNGGYTVLMAAALGHAPEVIIVLLARGAGEVINVRTSCEGLTALMHAVRTGNVESVAALLAYLAIDINVSDNHGRTALSWAQHLHINPDIAHLIIARSTVNFN